MKILCCLVVISALAFGNAKRCDTPCTRELWPVCGTDGENYKVFANKCLLRNQHCKDGHNWHQTRMDECKLISQYRVKERCEVPCTGELRPVCGTDGTKSIVFPNPCLLRNQHCQDGHIWFQVHMDSCGNQSEFKVIENCPLVCPAVYAPVCGFDGENYKVFRNKCIMGVDGCRFHKAWTQTNMEGCRTNGELEGVDNCPKVCPELYAPVCAFDGENYRIFSNKCMLIADNCRRFKSWSVRPLKDCTMH